ncbi:hypothetical protein SJA_C1-34430 [Sphingobium indicum UT26S]|uniref:Uncharacterized protein n=1 Tax=Sphingobium indicum (strain DSM 16413 / CCM 7287 / MTCC 6362 / UT26 / NBRC 101211 / UT26S) TaxID=452662 RepID=D4Z6P5_SPHIU|nr:hypothetical protein SJA_C1-34430 [Sphingobium indicum UT26S]
MTAGSKPTPVSLCRRAKRAKEPDSKPSSLVLRDTLRSRFMSVKQSGRSKIAFDRHCSNYATDREKEIERPFNNIVTGLSFGRKFCVSAQRNERIKL